MGVLRQATHDNIYPFGHTVYQMLRMGVLRQATHDNVCKKAPFFKVLYKLSKVIKLTKKFIDNFAKGCYNDNVETGRTGRTS